MSERITTNLLHDNAENFYTTGEGAETILVMGSCRIMPCLNYLKSWNDIHKRFTIHCILPYLFNDEKIIELEKSERLLSIISETDIFIKEYHSNYGIFNTLERHEKNIYQFGMIPHTDITLPAFNDCFVMARDVMTWDAQIKEKLQTMKPQDIKNDIYDKTQEGFNKFYSNCAKSSFPEFADWFKENFASIRLFWNFNHITKNYSLEVFKRLNEKYLNLETTPEFLKFIAETDHLEGNFTYLTKMDIEFYGYKWR